MCADHEHGHGHHHHHGDAGHMHAHGDHHHHHPGGDRPHSHLIARRTLLGTLALMLGTRAGSAGAMVQAAAQSLQDRWIAQAPARHRQSAALRKEGLAEAFRGVTTDGKVIPGLYPVKATGLSTAPMREAAARFLASLTPPQRIVIGYDVDDEQWRNWANQHWFDATGLSLVGMSPAQRDAFCHMAETCLSAHGYALMRNIMRLNETLSEMTDEHAYLGEWRYTVVMFGTPSPTEPWGWQLVGHHNIINYFVLGDQVVMTPHFTGGEPVISEYGKYKGLKILQEEQGSGLAFVNALDRPARQRAILKSEKTGDLNVSEAFRDNLVLDYAGVPIEGLPGPRRRQMLDLIELYVRNMPNGHAKLRMDEVAAHLLDTHFAWIGATEKTSVFYYRIQSPVILIEFDHQVARTLGRFVPDPTVPIQQHIHCVVRTPNGNDYGRDLLRQHHLQHPHT